MIGARERGFTLLELIIAFTIMGLMAAILFGSFQLALNSYTKSQDRLEEEARKRALQDQILRQVGSLFPLQPTASFSHPQDPSAGGADPSMEMAPFPLFYGRPESMTFITVAPLMLLEHPGLTVVRYGLAEDEYGDPYLGAMETRFMGLDSFNEMVAVPRGKPYPLIEDIRDLAFEYYGYDPQLQDYAWYESWIGDEMLSAPSAVKIHYDERHLVIPINAGFSGPANSGLQGLLAQ
ncbi:MAG: PulJ/GspJ family protein [Acidobacteriota bacterium]